MWLLWYMYTCKGRTTVVEPGATVALIKADRNNKQAIFKNCTPFTNSITEINETHVDNTEYLDVVISIYNLIEYSKNYWHTSGRLWQYYRDEPANLITNSASFRFKIIR